MILCLSSMTSYGQSSFQGGTFQGLEAGEPLPRQLGVYGWWDAGMGVQTNSISRVSVWTDQSGNGFNMSNYSNVISGMNSQPTFTREPATNFFPALNLTLPAGTGNPRPLRLFGTFPEAFAGIDKPFTFITLCAPITNSSGGNSWAFQRSNGTNSLTSIMMGFIPLTGGNQFRLNRMGDTNRSTVALVNLGNAQISISNYYYSTFTYDGVNARAYVNLTAGTNNVPVSQGITTANYFQLAGCSRTNFSGSDVNGQAYMTAFLAWTNALSGSQVTNVINWYNQNRYKTF